MNNNEVNEAEAIDTNLSDLIISGKLKVSKEWAPLKDVLRQVNEKVQIQQQKQENRILRREAAKTSLKQNWPHILLFFVGYVPLISLFMSFFGAAFLTALWITLIAGILFIAGIQLILIARMYLRMLQGEIPQGLDYKQAMREGALQAAAKPAREALSYAFDDAYILMDELALDEQEDLISNAMQTIRQTLGSMIMAGAVMKRIDEYIKTRPDYVKRAAKRKEANMGEEVELYNELVSDQQELLNGIEISRQQISILRGTLLKMQSQQAKDLMHGNNDEAMRELENAQEAAFSLERINQRTTKRLDIQSSATA